MCRGPLKRYSDSVRSQCRVTFRRRRETFYDERKKTLVKDLFVLWLALSALVCAALNLHVSLNMLGNSEKRE